MMANSFIVSFSKRFTIETIIIFVFGPKTFWHRSIVILYHRISMGRIKYYIIKLLQAQKNNDIELNKTKTT